MPMSVALTSTQSLDEDVCNRELGVTLDLLTKTELIGTIEPVAASLTTTESALVLDIEPVGPDDCFVCPQP